MSGIDHKKSCVAVVALLAALFTLPAGTAYADEATDISRILELNDAYAEAARAWRAREITRADMQEIHKAVQAESRQINARYGTTGSPERRAWDRAIQQAKSAHARQKRQHAQAARAGSSAAQRANLEAERTAEATAAAEQPDAPLEADARLTAELRTQMREDFIDQQTGWIPYATDAAVRDQHQQLVATWSRGSQSARFNRRVLEHFVDLLRERSSLTTSERRAPLPAPSASVAAVAAERDAASWLADQPPAADVIAAYPGDDPKAVARRAAALSLVAQWFPQIPNWGKTSLKGTLLESEYHLAMFELDQRFPSGSAERTTFDQSKAMVRQNADFVREVAEAFQPQQVARQDAAAEWHRTRANSDAMGSILGRGLAAVLTAVVLIWAMLSMIQTHRGGFAAKEVDGRLDVAYARNKHGILALLAAAAVWGLLSVIVVGLLLPDEEPQFLHNAVLRDPSNAGFITFTLNFLLFGMPAAGLLILNLLRLGTSRFSITPAGVIVGNRTYLTSEEQCFFVQAPDTGPERTIAQHSGGVYFIGSGPAVAAAMTGAAVAQGMRAGQQAAHGIGRLLALAIARARYSIRFTHRAGTNVLAKGLSRRRANAILDRIGDYVNAEPLDAATD